MREKNGLVPEKVIGTAKGSYSGNAPIGPPFAVITASTLLGKLSTRFRSVFMGIFDHSSLTLTPIQQNVTVPDQGRSYERIWCRSTKRIRTSVFIHNGPTPAQIWITDPEQIWAGHGPVQLMKL